jgi:hypothetical protein
MFYNLKDNLDPHFLNKANITAVLRLAEESLREFDGYPYYYKNFAIFVTGR